MNATTAEQVECPAELRYQPPPSTLLPTNYDSAPPGKRDDYFQVQSMPTGRDGYVHYHQFFTDDRGMLWLSGLAYVEPYPTEDRLVHIERLASGVRVLNWSGGQKIRPSKPNVYGWIDAWVVELRK